MTLDAAVQRTQDEWNDVKHGLRVAGGTMLVVYLLIGLSWWAASRYVRRHSCCGSWTCATEGMHDAHRH